MSEGAGLKRFVILAAPRCGSNWLCTLLDSHPQILCHHELFNPGGIHIAWSLRRSHFSLGDMQFRQSHPLGFLQRAWDRHLCFNTIGFKLNIDSPTAVFNAVLEDDAVLKIVLERQSRIRSFLSENIAEKTGVWESYPDSRDQPGTLETVHVNAVELMAHAERNRKYYAGLRSRLSDLGQSAHEVVYEHLGEVETRRDLLQFLGVSDRPALVGNTRRINPQPLPSLIANYRQLCDELRDTPLAGEIVDSAPMD